MSQISVDIVTPGGIKFQGQVVGLTAPGAAGKFQIFYNHAAMLANLEAGALTIIFEDHTESLQIGGGLLEVTKNRVSVMVESAEWPGKTDLNR
jgi:F-type H+-transporting ATPase subunit epsilon